MTASFLLQLNPELTHADMPNESSLNAESSHQRWLDSVENINNAQCII